MTIDKALADARARISSDSARLDAELLLGQVLGKSRTYLYTWPERALTTGERQQFQQLLARREGGEPVAHILGQREFWSLPIQVNNTTLIPRPDTELLVEVALACLEAGGAHPGRILDLGTGSGAIALALASELPPWDVVAVDRVEQAVSLAEHNRQQLGITNMSVQRSDWFSCVSGRFDLIVSNPPYIAAEDPHLHQGDVRFEPHSALVAGSEGLADLAMIIDQAPGFLKDDGWLWLEHGWQQGPAVRELLQGKGYIAVRSEADLGGHERVTGGQWCGSRV